MLCMVQVQRVSTGIYMELTNCQTDGSILTQLLKRRENFYPFCSYRVPAARRIVWRGAAHIYQSSYTVLLASPSRRKYNPLSVSGVGRPAAARWSRDNGGVEGNVGGLNLNPYL